MDKKSRHYIFALFTAIAATIAACSDDDFRMNSSFIDTATYAEFTDKTPIELSTFRLDSVLTSGRRKVWVGQFNRPVLGDIHSESFVRLSQPSRYEWAVKEKYDSVTMVLRHTGEYEGDTMQHITVDVRRLAEKLEFRDEKVREIYNVATYRDSTSIGSFTFKPKPHNRPRVRFRLNDDFGQELVKFIKDNKSTSADQLSRRFENFLGGIKITYNGKASSMLAFLADSVKIVLHSHMPLMHRKEIERTLYMTNSELQFNHTWNDNMDTPYETLTQRYKQVREGEGGTHSAMFEGLGYYTRINFPTLAEMQNQNVYSHVVKATLKLYPERDSYDKHRIPETFFLTEINRGNVLQNAVINSSQRRVAATLVNNILDEDEAYYSIDLTYYINMMLSKEYIDPEDGLVITWGNGMSPTDYNFMVFNGHGKTRYKSKLEIYYYNYDKEDR